MFKGLILTTLISAINVAPIATYRPTLYDLDYPQAELNNYTLRQVFEEQILPLPVDENEYSYQLPDGTTFYGTDSGYYVQQITDYTLVNLVSNSDLLIPKASPNENQPLGFKFERASNISLSNGICSFTSSNSWGQIQSATYSFTVGHKIYYYGRFKSDNKGYIHGPANISGSIVFHNDSGDFQFISNIVPADGILNYIQVGDGTTGGGKTIEVDYMGAINLTDTFGKDNEPTKEQMDTIIKLKGYFDTTTIDIKDLLVIDKYQETRMTPTLTNATTTYLTYRKDDLGYVDIVGDLTITTFGTNFTLPEGYRPLTQLRLPILTSTNTLGYIIINTNGTVVSNANATIYINARFATI